MPVIKSAQKALRQNIKKKKENLIYKKKMRDLLKKMDSCLAENDKEKAKELIPLIYKNLDKMAKKGIIKKNTSARKKSRISKKLNLGDQKH